MSLDIQIINPITYPNWDNLLEGTEGNVFSNSTAWVKILHESYGYTPLYFSIFENSRLSALIPVIEVRSALTGSRGVSLPFTDYLNLIMSNEEQFTYLFNQIIAYGKKRGWKYFEFRNGKRYLRDEARSLSYFGHILDLTDDETQIYDRFRESTKRNIKRAVTQGVNVKLCTSLDTIKEYYKLHCITRKRQGIPPQPFIFFKKIHNYIISKNGGIVILATYQDIILAGAVFFHFGDNVSFKFGASNKNYQNHRANNLVMWKAIKHYSNSGFKSFCFGRTDLDNQGLRQFKSGWRPEENIINYYRYDIKKDAFVDNPQRIKPLYNKIFRKMPIPLLKMAGTLLYKHIG
jgi:hypothetical protein